MLKGLSSDNKKIDCVSNNKADIDWQTHLLTKIAKLNLQYFIGKSGLLYCIQICHIAMLTCLYGCWEMSQTNGKFVFKELRKADYYSFIKLLIVIKSVMAFCNSEDRPFYNVNNKFCSIDDTSSKRRIVRNAQHVINSWKTKFFSVIFKYRYLNMEQGTQLNSVFPSTFLPGQWTLIYKTKCM